MAEYQTTEELQLALGRHLRALRLDRNLDRISLAARAGISLTAAKNIEAGRGTLRTLVAILRALGRESWLATVAPVATINPLSLPKAGTPRQRAARRRMARP